MSILTILSQRVFIIIICGKYGMSEPRFITLFGHFISGMCFELGRLDHTLSGKVTEVLQKAKERSFLYPCGYNGICRAIL